MSEIPPETFLPTARAMVIAQLEYAWAEVSARLATLSQEELDREPAPGALRVVRRGQERQPRTVGAGDWVAEWPQGYDEPLPRTIGWLVAHLTEVFGERREWTFGEHRRRREEFVLHGEVRAAVAGLTHEVDAWRAGVRALGDEDVFTVGRSTATPIDAQAPFGHLVLHLNRELIHHGSEICVLTDLYRAAPRPADGMLGA
ncbi:DinB family protein [Cellulomonas endophytica]|uniref:DinB family protein n=1 Tax=Cellulomonas endophytica TaxID=2494735 RepID=UPI0010130834|nr:DinB family protein [Cellulomonas endophytica]